MTADQDILSQVDNSVLFLERELAAGKVIYGVNTGFGGSADTRTHDFERLQSAAIQHLNVGILLRADKGLDAGGPERGDTHSDALDLLRSHALPAPIVRAAMLIRCNSLLRGHSGVRLSVIRFIMTLLDAGITPVVPLRGSISASGDLSTLSYIAGTIEGNPDIFVRHGSTGNILSASEALRSMSLQPLQLQAKEGLGITNGTAPSCATACIVMHQANRLALLTQLLTAMGTEALAGTAHNYHPFISEARPHAGQAEAASNILKFLAGSVLSPDRGPEYIGLAQDRYALRTAPQWIGPQLEDLMLATRQVATELNSTTDNPLIDVAAGRIHHGGNFQAAAITSAMEKTTMALQNLGRLLFAQSSELINNATNKGLPPNLSADEPSGSFTFKGFDVNMAAYMAELAYLAHPVSSHVQTAEMTNQSVNSMALVAARYALDAVEVLSLMAATYICTLCQALDLRCMQREFRAKAVVELAARWSSPASDSPTGDLGKHEEILVGSADIVLQHWDRLAHLDTAERSVTAARESMGALMHEFTSSSLTTLSPPTFQQLVARQNYVASALQSTYDRTRDRFFRAPSTDTYIGPASNVIYKFVRDELGIPLNRGVEDHPPLLLRAAQQKQQQQTNDDGGVNGNGVEKVKGEAELAARGRILGTMASEIYEAIRDGRLHDRIMQFGEEAKLWGN